MITGADLTEQQYNAAGAGGTAGANEVAYSPDDPAPQLEGQVPDTPSPTDPGTPLDCIAYASQQEQDDATYPQVIRAADRDFLLFNHEVKLSP